VRFCIICVSLLFVVFLSSGFGCKERGDDLLIGAGVQSVSVTAPNGGELWMVGDTYDISWSTIGVTNVRIELSRDGGAGWEDIAASVPASDLSYSWTVTDGGLVAVQSQCLVRISDTSDDTVKDESDSYFTVSPWLALLTGSGGRVAWYKGPAAHELVAFDRIVDDVTKDTEIFTMEPDGTDIQPVTESDAIIPKGFIGQPEWHPDGDHIILQAENVNSSRTAYFPAYSHVSFGINNDLWIINKDGTGAEKIYSAPDEHWGCLHPHFNEDGTKIIFSEREATGVSYPILAGITPGGENPWAGWRIHVADFDINGVGEAKLSNHVILFGGGVANDRGIYETHGFKDADTIVFSYTADGDNYVDDIYTSKLDGSELTNLTNTPGIWDEHGTYSPSGDTMCFNSSRSDAGWFHPPSGPLTLRTELHSMRVSDGLITQLTFFNQNGDPDRRYLASDFEWDRSGRRIVVQAGSVDIATGLPGLPEIWLLTFPEVQ